MKLDNDAARVIRDITKTPIYVPEGEGEINVCEAVKDMINESRQEGKVEGKAEGRIEGREEGKAEGKNPDAQRISKGWDVICGESSS